MNPDLRNPGLDQLNESLYNVMIEWENGDLTSEPLSNVAPDDPVACDLHEKHHNVL